MTVRRPLAGAGLVLLACTLCTSAQEPKYDLAIDIDKIQLGNIVSGPSVTVADFKGKVVLIEAWGINDTKSQTTMPMLVRWHNDLGGFGLLLIAAHSGEATADVLKAKAKSLGMTFTVAESAFVKAGSINLPHVYLFDHTGKCIYRGGPEAADAKVRQAVGVALADLGQPATSKSVIPLLDALKKGQPPLGMIPKVLPLLKSSDKATADEAQKLLDRLTEAGRKKIELAEKFLESDPIEAFTILEPVPADFKGTPVAAKATTLLTTLRKDKAVIEEQKAKPMLESVKKLDAFLTRQLAGKLDPKDPAFQRQNAAGLASLRTSVQQMLKTYPKARASQEAVQIAEKYGLAIR